MSARRRLGQSGFAFALVCVGYDLLVSTLCACHYCEATAASKIAFTFMLAQLGTAAYIFRSFWTLEKVFRVHRRTNSQNAASDGSRAHLYHMSIWLTASGVCMLANIVGLGGYAASFSRAADMWMISSWVAIVYFSRMGTSFAQVMSLSMPHQTTRAHESADYVTVVPQDERSRESTLNLQHLVLGQEPQDHVTAGVESSGSAVVGFANTFNHHASDSEEREQASDEARDVQIEEISQGFETTLVALRERVQLAELHQHRAEEEAKAAQDVLQAAQQDTRAAEDDAKTARQEAKGMRLRAEYSFAMQQMAETESKAMKLQGQIAQLEMMQTRQSAEEAVLRARLEEERATEEAQVAKEQLKRVVQDPRARALENDRIKSTAGLWEATMSSFKPLSFSRTRALLERERNEAVARWAMGPGAQAEINRPARRNAYDAYDEPDEVSAAAAAYLGLARRSQVYDQGIRSHNAEQQDCASVLARAFRNSAARRIQRFLQSHARRRLYRKYYMAVCFASRLRLPRPLVTLIVGFAVSCQDSWPESV